MSALQAKKRKEAEDAVKQANKLLEKTMFRWQPDYLAAAPLLEKAADGFRASGDLEMAKKVFAQAATVQNKNKSAFRAAQNCENVAKIVVQQLKETRATGAVKDKYLEEMKKSYEAACSYYSDMGELGKSADALLKGATACEENGSDDVRDMYMRACSLMEAQGKPHFAVDVFRKTLSYLVKTALYADAVVLLQRQIAIFVEIDQKSNIHKCYLSEIILLLVLGDVAAADKAYMGQLQSDEFLKSDECALAEDLVRAYKLGNEELLQQTIRKQGFSFLDNQIGRLVRKLSIFGGGASGSGSSAANSSSGAAASAPGSRTASGSGGTGSQRTASSGSKNPFAPAVVKDRYAPMPVASSGRVTTASPPSAPSAAPAAAPVMAAYSEYDDVPTESFASVTVASEDDRTTNEFDFDALEFSTTTAADVAAAAAEEEAKHAPAVDAAAPPHEEDTLDLT